MSSFMVKLVEKFGEPPYRPEHLYRLRDECQALICALEGGHVVERDSGLTLFGIMEVMANIVVTQPRAINSLYSDYLYDGDERRRVTRWPMLSGT